jgi:ribosomal protein S7
MNIRKSPLLSIFKSIEVIRPLVRFEYRVNSGKKYKIPTALGFSERDYFQGLQWLFFGSKFFSHRFLFTKRLAFEVSATLRQTSSSIKSLETFHRLASTSQSFLKFAREKQRSFFRIKYRRKRRVVRFRFFKKKHGSKV